MVPSTELNPNANYDFSPKVDFWEPVMHVNENLLISKYVVMILYS